ncbi:MAG TPA: multicopper oxidase domain-containing protein [Anaerolineales bacterium]|nr:multicopper oxidase domain-containing protein [Anaerolineales bacterium]
MNHLSKLSRRNFLKLGTLGTLGVAGVTALAQQPKVAAQESTPTPVPYDHSQFHDSAHGGNLTVGDVDTSVFDPTVYAATFEYGKVSQLPNGQTLREWNMYAVDHEVEIAPGIKFPGWAYGLEGQPPQIPGPTFRCTEGDRLRIHFTNGSAHPHTVHFHGIHPPSMDGITPILNAGESFTYEFNAKPFGLHLYHCHTPPLKKHIHKGLYGTFIIDPPGGRAPAREFVMMMNAFDTNFDGENEIYAANTVAFHYAKHPLQVKVGELIRIYLVNITEFDPVNSLHLHAGMYKLFRTGTRLDNYEYTDVVTMGQGERHVLEMTLEYPGLHMFHAHQSELAELGWMGMFEATE